MIDKFYTPSFLAKTMVKAVPSNFYPINIADFAAGEGSLLSAAKKKWPKAKIVANDLCRKNSKALQLTFPNASISTADFLNSGSRKKAKFYPFINQLDLILINPPFSQRGLPLSKVRIGEQNYTVGLAFDFLFSALQYLSPEGYLVAILPNGCLCSQRDAKAWLALKAEFDVKIICNNSIADFSQVSATTSIISVRRREKKAIRNLTVLTAIEATQISIIRGKCAVHKVQDYTTAGTLPFVHTKQLQKSRVNLDGPKVRGLTNISGPGVLFPRVGRMYKDKICVLADNQPVVISDCVFFASCTTFEEAELLRVAILKYWKLFVSKYNGTGAQYITMDSASRVLAKIKHLSRIPSRRRSLMRNQVAA